MNLYLNENKDTKPICKNCIYYKQVCSAYGFCNLDKTRTAIDIVSLYKVCPFLKENKGEQND